MGNSTVYKGVTIVTEGFDMVTEAKVINKMKEYLSKNFNVHDAALSVATLCKCDVENRSKKEIKFISRQAKKH